MQQQHSATDSADRMSNADATPLLARAASVAYDAVEEADAAASTATAVNAMPLLENTSSAVATTAMAAKHVAFAVDVMIEAPASADAVAAEVVANALTDVGFANRALTATWNSLNSRASKSAAPAFVAAEGAAKALQGSMGAANIVVNSPTSSVRPPSVSCSMATAHARHGATTLTAHSADADPNACQHAITMTGTAHRHRRTEEARTVARRCRHSRRGEVLLSGCKSLARGLLLIWLLYGPPLGSVPAMPDKELVSSNSTPPGSPTVTQRRSTTGRLLGGIATSAHLAEERARAWLADAKNGFCGHTSHEMGYNCSSGTRGSFGLSVASSKSLLQAVCTCLRKCELCERCKYITVNPQIRDCSWYAKCDLTRLHTKYDGFLSGPVHQLGLDRQGRQPLPLQRVLLFMHLEKTAGTLVRHVMKTHGWHSTHYCAYPDDILRQVQHLLLDRNVSKVFVEHHCRITWCARAQGSAPTECAVVCLTAHTPYSPLIWRLARCPCTGICPRSCSSSRDNCKRHQAAKFSSERSRSCAHQ